MQSLDQLAVERLVEIEKTIQLETYIHIVSGIHSSVFVGRNTYKVWKN